MADDPVGLESQAPDVFGRLSQLQSIAHQGMANQQLSRQLTEQKNIAGVDWTQFQKPDGSMDVPAAQAAALKASPTFYGQERAAQVQSLANDRLAMQKGQQSLNKEQRDDIASSFTALAADPDYAPEKLIDTADRLKEQNKSPEFRAMVNVGLKHILAMPLDKQKQALLNAGRGSGSASEVAGPGGLAAPNVQGVQGVGHPGQPGTGEPGIVPTNMNPLAPGGVGQVGPVQQQSVAPGATPVTDAYGRTSVFNPQRNTVAPIGGAGVAPGGGSPSAFVQPVAGQRQVEQDVDTARKAGDSGGQVRAINDKLLSLSEQTRTGPGAQSVQKLAAALNLPSGSNYQEINAYLERQAAAAGQAMGLPNTNAGLHAAQQASGTAEYTPQALQEKVKFADSLNSGVMAYRQGLDKLVGTGATPDYTKYQAYRSAWAQNFSPDVFRAEDALRRGDKKELEGIKSELGSRGMAEMKKRADNLRMLENGQIPQ